MNDIQEGWAKPKGSTTYHFYRDHQSVCGRPYTRYTGILLGQLISSEMKCQNCRMALSAQGKTAILLREGGDKQ